VAGGLDLPLSPRKLQAPLTWQHHLSLARQGDQTILASLLQYGALFDSKYRMARRFCGKIAQIRIGFHIEEWSHDRHLSKVRLQHRSGLAGGDFSDRHGLDSRTASEPNLPRRASISDPGDFAVRCDQPTFSILLDESHRRGIERTTLSAMHS
jgi:hypothetical protein